MSIDGRTQILILGGGFGGLYAAMRLEKTLARDPNVEVTLVNRDNFFLFTPMLHEVAASDLDLTHIVNPVHKLLRRVNFFAGDVEAIDLPGRRVVVSHGFDHHHHDMPYDHLVIALGSITNFFNLPGLQERALTMKSLGDAITLRNRLIALLEEANSECCANIREPLLTFVVAGGGFAGVETIAAVNDFVRDALKFYPNCHEQHLRMVLVHPGPVILPELGEELGTYAQKKLAERKVDIRVNTRVTGISDRGVELNDGTIVTGNTPVWTAGTSPNPLLETLPYQKERGRLQVNEYLEVPEWPGVWALGDCAVVPEPQDRQSLSTDSPTCPAQKPFVFEPSGNWPPSADVRGWPTSWGSISQASSPGGCGARSTSGSCRGLKRSCESPWIGRWISSSRRISSSL
jgi:NADH:ubiquinone reductase (H+-translocating)